MRKIVKESYQDIAIFLRSSELVNMIIDEFGEDFYDKNNFGQVTEFVVDKVLEMFDEPLIVDERVIVCKVVGTNVDLVDTDQYVVNFNGTYYDYTAQKYNDSFNDLINVGTIPVVQNIIHSDNQITDKLSTVKGYVILGY